MTSSGRWRGPRWSSTVASQCLMKTANLQRMVMYMEIPEITASQLEVMQKICFDPEMSVFSQCSVKPTDPLKEATKAQRARVDAEHLCTIGFLKNITAEHQERINQL